MTYLVGYSPHKDDSCALALACQFARSESDTVTAVTVVPRGWETVAGSATDGDFEQWAAEEGEASAAEAQGRLGAYPDVQSSAIWVTGRSVPAAILDEAKRLDAALIVVGSAKTAPRARSACRQRSTGCCTARTCRWRSHRGGTRPRFRRR